MKRAALAFVVSSLVAACGGKGGGGTTPSPSPSPSLSADPCTAGLHAAGISANTGSWDAVAAFVSSTADAMCEASPCGPFEQVSFVGSAPDDAIAVGVNGRWTVIGDVWDSDEDQPDATYTMLGDAVWLHLRFEETGRDDVELDDGTQTTATVITGERFEDFVIDTDGKVLFRAVCASEGEGGAERATVIARDGDTYSYTRCKEDATPVRFTAAQASECPRYIEGAR